MISFRICLDGMLLSLIHICITVTVDSDSYQLIKAYDVNISGLVSTTMQNEARRLRAERWKAENQEGMAEVCLLYTSQSKKVVKGTMFPLVIFAYA